MCAYECLIISYSSKKHHLEKEAVMVGPGFSIICDRCTRLWYYSYGTMIMIVHSGLKKTKVGLGVHLMLNQILNGVKGLLF